MRRFRSQQLALGERLRAFRDRHGITQEEVARVVGAGDRSAVSQLEGGLAVPDGVRRERLVALLEGRLWAELWAAAISGEGLPAPWDRAVRWYRRASRERRSRETIGVAVVAILDELRGVASREALRAHYCTRDGDWAHCVAGRCGRGPEEGVAIRRIEDAACGLRWLELASGLRLDLRRSLVPQLPLTLLDEATDAS